MITLQQKDDLAHKVWNGPENGKTIAGMRDVVGIVDKFLNQDDLIHYIPAIKKIIGEL